MSVQRSGRVAKRRVRIGSKSEREAVVIDTADGSYVLRRVGGNAFQDDDLEKLVGKRLSATGIVRGSDFIMSTWSEEPD